MSTFSTLAASAAIAILAATGMAGAKPFNDQFPGLAAQFDDDIRVGLEALDLKQGKVFLGDNIAAIDVSQDFYFLDAADAAYVLTEIWGNPSADGTLGMIFPADAAPVDTGAWGIEITFDDIGYVSDEDAGSYDYKDLLVTMQKDLAAENKWRTDNGYETVELIGWAAEPHYDQTTRKLHWAKRLKFSDSTNETLNYNIRALGRKGVLVVNFIAGMDQLPEVEAAVPSVLTMVNFTEGNRYADFDPGLDKVAAVGIGGLIAGKVLAKTGLLAVALVFLKKFWFLALLPLFALKKLFARRA